MLDKALNKVGIQKEDKTDATQIFRDLYKVYDELIKVLNKQKDRVKYSPRHEIFHVLEDSATFLSDIGKPVFEQLLGLVLVAEESLMSMYDGEYWLSDAYKDGFQAVLQRLRQSSSVFEAANMSDSEDVEDCIKLATMCRDVVGEVI